jgi:hypothetical protein
MLMKKLSISLAWIVSSIFIGAYLGFLVPFLAYETSAQISLYGISMSGAIGMLLGGSGGAFYGAYRSKKWRNNAVVSPVEINTEVRT